MSNIKGANLSICSLLFFQTYHLRSSHVSAYSIEFAVQIHKNREHVSRYLYPKREKVSAWELSDDFGTAYGPFLLVGETIVSRQVMQKEPKLKFQLFMAES